MLSATRKLGAVSVAAIALVAVAIWALGTHACGERSPTFDESEPVLLRVSATAGLGSFVPNGRPRGSTAAAADLVFDPVARYASLESREGRVVTLALNSSPDGIEAAALAGLIRFDGIRSSVAAGDRVRVEFTTEESALAFVDALPFTGVATGPFREPKIDGVVLESRGTTPIDRIEIVEVSKDDEWRLFLGRRIDVIPRVEAARRLEVNAGTIRIVELETTRDYALLFNVERPAVSRAAVRRAIAHMIDRASLSEVVCGSSDCVVPVDVDSSDAPLTEAALRLLVIEGETVAALAASVVRKQLRKAGVEVEVHVEPIQEAWKKWTEGEFDLALAPFPRGVAKYPAVLALPYTDTAFRAAVERRDFAKADRLLRSQAPATRLFEIRHFAAIDTKWCGDVTPRADSWRWIADLRPCRKGESP